MQSGDLAQLITVLAALPKDQSLVHSIHIRWLGFKGSDTTLYPPRVPIHVAFILSHTYRMNKNESF